MRLYLGKLGCEIAWPGHLLLTSSLSPCLRLLLVGFLHRLTGSVFRYLLSEVANMLFCWSE